MQGMIPRKVGDRLRPLIRTGAAAAVAGCHPTTILRAIERGELEAVRLGRRGDHCVFVVPSTAGAPRRERGLGVRLGTMLGGDDLTETRAREREQHRREQRLRIGMRARGARRDAAQAGRAAGVPWQARRRDRSQALLSSSVASGARGCGATVATDLRHAAFVRDVGARRRPRTQGVLGMTKARPRRVGEAEAAGLPHGP